jgi:FixJ family two-component response regulator
VTPIPVCVIDDEPAVCKALARVLRSAHYSVTTAASAEVFLEQWAARPPRCVVLDLNLPGMSGLELLAVLRTRMFALPVVIVTAQDTTVAREQAKVAGAAAFLTKPVDADRLIAAVQGALGSGE